MDATTLWFIYIITIGILFIILNLLSTNCGVIWFLSSLIAALILFVCLLWVDFFNINESDQLLIAILIIIAFLLPVIIVIYLIWTCGLICDVDFQLPDNEIAQDCRYY